MSVEFGNIRRVPLREIWPKEALSFTPWLADNLDSLGEVLGLDLELIGREAAAGDFSLDLLAKDLSTGRKVVIENQITQTDHDHLGKLLTYASAFDASVVVWIAEALRDEHRQALEWLNQRTNTETEFFGIVVEVLAIDDSKPAYNFKLVVFPNEWRKQKGDPGGTTSPRAETYRRFFQALIDELREKHRFTNARIGQPQNWYSFASGISGIYYAASFAHGGRVRVEIYIDFGDAERNKAIFDILRDNRDRLEASFGEPLEWERLDDRRASRIAVYRPGSIEEPNSEIESIKQWMVARLLRFRGAFQEPVKRASVEFGESAR